MSSLFKKISRLPAYLWHHKKLSFVFLLILAGFLAYKPFGLIGGSKSADYKIQVISRGDLSTTINVSGIVQAENLATMEFLSTGRVSYLGFKEGDKVISGQVIASLDSIEAQDTVSKDQALLKSAQSAVDKVYDDIRLFQYGNGGTTGETQAQKTTREQAETARDAAYQDLQKAQKELQWETIIAPFDGVISNISGIAVGENVGPTSGASVTEVGDGRLKFIANVDETEYGQLRLGQSGKILLDAFPDETFNGTITKFGVTAVKLETGGSVVPVEVSLPDDARLKNALNGEVDFTVIGKSNVFTLPRSAVKDDGTNSYIYLKINNKPVRQNIITGMSLGSRVEIVSGLKSGDEVIISEIAQ